MMSFACFNELSTHPLCGSVSDAEQRVRVFLSMFKEVRTHTGITKVRHAGEMTTIPLTEALSLQDYLNSHTTNPTVIALLGIFIHPQVDIDDDISLRKYYDTTTKVKTGDNVVIPADGFNAAYCQNTFCVGFESCATWQNVFFDLEVLSNGKMNNVNWVCISSVGLFGDGEEVASRKSSFDKWLLERNVDLVESSLPPEKKPSDVDGDHGQQLLKEHARLLNRHPYVDGVLTSLPFKPHSREYVLKIYDDGLLDIVLWWEDAGYSMRVKTTGRNVAETKEIAKILREKFGRHK